MGFLFNTFTIVLLGQDAINQKITIPFYETTANVVEIDVKINGYNQRFIFDTGASNVSFGRSFYEKLKKYNYISAEEIGAKTKIKIADGSLIDVTLLNIKSVTIGKVQLKNIEATVVDSDDVPFLIGQSVFNQFSSITIDNQNNSIQLSGFQQSVFGEIRIVPCNKNAVSFVGQLKASLSGSNKLQIKTFTEETNVPPPPDALKRIYKKITIRYFSKNDFKHAEKLREEFLAGGNQADEIYLEDMTKYYSNEIPSYFEIWIK